jgi:hypothetical protein
MAWSIEYTDTYAGKANYCWVRRATIESNAGESQSSVMRRAKAAVGLTGAKGRTNSYGGDGWEFRPYRSCTVLFVLWTDAEPDREDSE